MPDDQSFARIHVGLIVNTHGLQGELKILSRTDFPQERFKIGNSLWVVRSDGQEQLMEIAAVREHKGSLLFRLQGLDTIAAAELLKGGYLAVDAGDRGQLSADEFYVQDILACEVFTEEDQCLGNVVDILRPGANDVWVVAAADGSQILVPYIDDVVLEVSLQDKRITVRIMEGMIE